jgi:hypothetical protein
MPIEVEDIQEKEQPAEPAEPEAEPEAEPVEAAPAEPAVASTEPAPKKKRTTPWSKEQAQSRSTTASGPDQKEGEGGRTASVL